MRILRRIYWAISYIVKRLIEKLFFLVEFFLFLRLVLKFFNANPIALVVSLIYEGTESLVLPFRFIFPNVYLQESYFIETATISAMIGYWIAVFLIFQLLRLFSRE